MGNFVVKPHIGLFGGTFNPIHFGHINLALEIKEKKQLDEVWFIPTYFSPFREHEPILEASHRLKLLELALEPIPGFKTCSIELDRPPPSYTIDTVKALIDHHPDYAFSLLCSQDTLFRFPEWKEPLELIRLVPIWIGSRNGVELCQHLLSWEIPEEMASAIREGVIVTRQMEISSTDIRERLKKKLYCGHLLPSKVLDYIYAHQLYFNLLI